MSIREEKTKYDNYKDSASKNQYRCLNCCRTVTIPKGKNSNLCPSCGQMIERNEKYNIENIMLKSRLQRSYYHFKKTKEM